MKWRVGEAVTDAWKNEARLEKRIEELEQRLKNSKQFARDILQIERERVWELEDALDKYGEHRPDCPMFKMAGTGVNRKITELLVDTSKLGVHCTCGLEQALKGKSQH